MLIPHVQLDAKTYLHCIGLNQTVQTKTRGQSPFGLKRRVMALLSQLHTCPTILAN